jgi:hypothetical protein
VKDVLVRPRSGTAQTLALSVFARRRQPRGKFDKEAEGRRAESVRTHALYGARVWFVLPGASTETGVCATSARAPRGETTPQPLRQPFVIAAGLAVVLERGGWQEEEKGKTCRLAGHDV